MSHCLALLSGKSRRRRQCLAFLAVLCLFRPIAARAAEPENDRGQPAPVSIMRSLERTNTLFHGGNLQEAMAEVTEALQASPLYPPLWLLKAKIHHALGENVESSEALDVFLTSEPHNEEAISLAVNAIFAKEDLSRDGSDDSLRDLIILAGDVAFGRALSHTLVERAERLFDLHRILAVWDGISDGGQGVLNILELYQSQAFSAAAASLLTASALDRPTRGALAYLVGRALGAQGRSEDAHTLLQLAGDLGFEADLVSWWSGWFLRDLGQNAEAVRTWQKNWRQTENPVQVAVTAADARLAAGDADGALRIVDSALTSFPGLPNLQARRLHLLRILELEPIRQVYENSLGEKNQLAGIYYNLALEARAEERFDLAEKALDETRIFATRENGIQLDLNQVENWLEFGHLLIQTGSVETQRRIMTLANRLFTSGRQADGVVIWENLLKDGMMPNPREQAMTIGRYLAENEMDGFAFARRYNPEISELDFLLALRQGNYFSALRNQLKRTRVPANAASSWPSLLLGLELVDLKQRETAIQAVNAFATFPPEQESFRVRYVDVNDLIQARTLNPADHRRLVGDLGAAIVLAGYEELYPVMLASLQWTPRDDSEAAILAPGIALAQAGENGNARKFLELALTGNGENSEALYYLALINERAGLSDAARRQAEKALGNVATPEIHERLLALQARLNRDDEAELVHQRKILELAPDDPGVRLDVIQKLAAAGHYDEAEELLRHFEESRTAGNTDILSYLALANLAVGRYEAAKTVWQTLIRLYPDSLQIGRAHV